MLTKKETTYLSKLLSPVLHHEPARLGYAAAAPPAVLYHGTARQHLRAIQAQGLRKMRRHHVHLSADLATPRQVGIRRGPVLVFEVATETLHHTGQPFYQVANGVWLT